MDRPSLSSAVHPTRRSQGSSPNILKGVTVRGHALIPSYLFVYSSLTLAKEKRLLYTLGPIPATVHAPPQPPSTPATPSNSLQPATGPHRTRQMSREARTRTAQPPPHLRAQTSASVVNVVPPQVATVSASTTETPIIGVLTTAVLPVATPEVDVSQTQADGLAPSSSGLTEPGAAGTTHADCTSESIPATDDRTFNSGSHTSTLPGTSDLQDFDMDCSGPLATGPWVAMDHFTGDIIVDDASSISDPTAGQTGMDVGLLPRLGTNALTETEAPSLLFEDEDVRPDWLNSAVKEFLRYTPYYGCLGEVIDQFLLQEARLGYPKLV